MKHLIFSETIFDGDMLAWYPNKEYIVMFENDELYYVTSENGNDNRAIEKKNEGLLFDEIISEQ